MKIRTYRHLKMMGTLDLVPETRHALRQSRATLVGEERLNLRRFGLLPSCAALLTLLASTPACNKTNTNTRQEQSKATGQRKPAPDFTLQDANGTSVKLSDLRGKVVVLNFWATWCGPCALEIPWFIEFEQQFKSRGLEIVGISMDEDGWKAIKPYVASHKMNYRVLLGNDSVGQLYGGVDSLPTTFVIDREGRLAFPPHVGLPGKNEYLNEIQTLLDEKQQTDSRAFIPGSLLLGAAAAGHR
ncbi:MAG: peroxiredoxin family protein [Bryobacteraceae bacterium]